MNIVFIGCVEFSNVLLERVLALPDARVVGIVTRAASTFNADFCSLVPVAERKGIPYFLFDKEDKSTLPQWIAALQPDILYCFGWSFLLDRSILDIPRLGCVGYHPAALPQNRGRHPIVWTLVLGLEQTASTFFLMDEGADSGDIVSQEPVAVAATDDAASLYGKLLATALVQVEQFTAAFAAGTLQPVPQEHSRANSWRKRTADDGKIDWRMSTQSICNLVRGLARPYVGAHCVAAGANVTVWKVEPVACTLPNIEPGKVLASEGATLTVKTGDGAVRLLEHEFFVLPVVGEYL